MSQYKMLNNVEHANLRIITDRAPRYGDDVMFCMTFPFEFRLVLGHYPIVMYEDQQSGATFPVCLFGFAEGENLFLKEPKWDAPYIPLMIQRQPFVIATQQEQGTTDKKFVVSLDPNHPKVSEYEGEPIFNERGGYTHFLEQIVKMLESIDGGHSQNQTLEAALKKYDLLEPTTFEITLKDGSKHQLVGFSTVTDERFQALSADALADLNSRGILLPITMMMASMSQLRNLIERRNHLLDN